MDLVHVNVIAVIVAALVSMVLGWVWYSPALFGKRWMMLLGKSQEEIQSMGKNAGKYYALTLAGSLVLAFVLAQFVLQLVPDRTWAQGAQVGFWAWLGFALTTALSTSLFEGRKLELWFINQGYHLLEFLILGALLAAWK